MNKLIVRAVCALAASAACCGAFAEGTNLIDNGSFEAGFSGGWGPGALASTVTLGGATGSFSSIHYSPDPKVSSEIDQAFQSGEILPGNIYSVFFTAVGIGSVAVEMGNTRTTLTSTGIADANPLTTDYFDVNSAGVLHQYSFTFLSGASAGGRILFKATNTDVTFDIDNVQ